MRTTRRARARWTAFLFASLPCVPGGAAADESPPAPAPTFGSPGQFVMSALSDLGIASMSWAASDASSFSVTVSPGVDYFFARNLSAGLDLDFAYSDHKGYGADGSLVETKSTTFSGGPRLGLNVPFGGVASLYPRVTVGFESVRSAQKLVSGSTLSVANPLGYPTTTRLGPWISLYVPLLLHPASHVFLGAGPEFAREFGDAQGGPDIGGERTVVRVLATVGGTWGGDEPAVVEAPAVAQATRRAFGSAGEIAFDGEFGAAAWTWYDGTASRNFSGSIEPSVAYFVDDYFSIGLAPVISHASGTGIDASSGRGVSWASTEWGVEARLGRNAPLGPSFSFYPRFGLLVGGDSYDETSDAQRNTSRASRVAIHAFAPLLVHPAPHLFAGFGPEVIYDVSRSVSYPQGPPMENKTTTVGASLVVGGWVD